MPTRVIVDDGAERARTEGEAGDKPASGTVTIATYNVRDGRGGGEDGEEFLGIVSAARAMEMIGVDVAVLQETKIVDPEFASRSFGDYSILAAAADSERRGGVALLVRESDAFTVENERARGANIISFELITGQEERWFVVGCYLPPSDKGGGGTTAIGSRAGAAAGGDAVVIAGRLERRPGLSAEQTGGGFSGRFGGARTQVRDKPFRHAPQKEMQREVDVASAEQQQEGGARVA